MRPEYQAIIDEHDIWPNGFERYDERDLAWQPEEEREIDLCVAFLRRLPLVKRFTRGSYGLKHDAEHWAGEYVCNGALLVAAFHLGIPVQHRWDDGPNGALPIGARSRWPSEVRERVIKREAPANISRPRAGANYSGPGLFSSQRKAAAGTDS